MTIHNSENLVFENENLGMAKAVISNTD